MLGDTVEGGEDALCVEREGDRADFLQACVAALQEAGVLIRMVPRGNLAAERREMMPEAVGAAPQSRCHRVQGRWRRLFQGVL